MLLLSHRLIIGRVCVRQGGVATHFFVAGRLLPDSLEPASSSLRIICGPQEGG